MREWFVNDEFEGVWKKAVVYFLRVIILAFRLDGLEKTYYA